MCCDFRSGAFRVRRDRQEFVVLTILIIEKHLNPETPTTIMFCCVTENKY